MGCGAGLGCLQTLGAEVDFSLWSRQTPAKPESQHGGRQGAPMGRRPDTGQRCLPDPGHTRMATSGPCGTLPPQPGAYSRVRPGPGTLDALS